jgi:hypothetical protein
MYFYIDALVGNTELAFGPEILKTIFELYFDLIAIYVTIEES